MTHSPDCPLHEISESEAREIAADWHGGQTSALYAFSSTGTILSGLEREIRNDLTLLTDSGQYGAEEIAEETKRLNDLLAYVEGWTARCVMCSAGLYPDTDAMENGTLPTVCDDCTDDMREQETGK